MLLLSLLICLAAGPLTGALAGEPPPSPHDDQSELLLHVNDLLDHSATLDAAGSTTTAPDTAESTTAAPEGDVHQASAAPEGDAGATPATAEDAAGTTTATPAEVEVVGGGRERGGEIEINSDIEINPDTDSDTADTDKGTYTATGTDVAVSTTAEPSGETTTTVTGVDDSVATTAATEDLTTAAPTSAADDEDEQPAEATEDAAETTPTPADDAVTTTPGAASTSPTTELKVKLLSGMALRPSEKPLSRHRADPGLAQSETKLSKGRSGVPDPEMLDNQSKPRKGAGTPRPGVTPPTPVMPDVLSVTEGAPVTVSTTQNPGASFFGKTSSPTEEAGDEEDQPAPKKDVQSEAAARPKPTEDKDAAGGDSGPIGSLIAGAVVLVLVFAVIGFFVFRKARESWYRRHYRKMDFLVDGMYNL